MMRPITTVLAVTAATLSAHAGTPIAWTNAAGGFWDVASNWTPATVPGTTDDVVLGLTDPYTVTARFNQNAASLLISNPAARLDVSVFRVLSMFGPIENHGTITLNPTQTGAAAQLRFETSAALEGSGTLDLFAVGTLSELLTGTNAVITHGPDHEIIGQGQISATYVNNGTISATVPTAALQVVGLPKTNNALMRAVNGGILRLSNTTINQGPQGVILADGAGSRVDLSGVTVNAGTVRGQNGGVATVAINSAFNNVRTEGDVEVQVFRILDVQGSLTNAGTIRVNPTQTGAQAIIRFQDGATLTGSGVIDLSANDTLAELTTATDASMTHAAGHTIRGRGVVSTAMTNNGRINADFNGGRMRITGPAKTNNALIHATNGGTVDLFATTINNGPSGIIRAEADSRVELQNATITAGVLESIGTGRVVSVLDSTLNSVETRGNIDLLVFRTMNINGTLTNNATISVNPTQTGASANLRFANGSILAGSGSVNLVGNATLAQINTNAGDAMTHAAGHTIRGRGQINARMTNNGLITANETGSAMVLAGENKTNNSIMQAVNGGRLILQQNITVDQSANALILADGAGSVVDLSFASINGGTLDTANDGVIQVTNGNATVSGVTIDGFVQLGVFRTLALRTGTTLNGRIITNPTQTGATAFLRWDDTFELGGNGVITLFGNSSLSDISAANGITPILGPGIRLEGIGRIAAPTTIRGTIAPGNTGVGTMSASQPVTLTPSTTFEVQAAGPSNADRLTSISSFVADGTLAVSLVDGFNPAGYWTSTIVSAAQGITGRFDTIIAPPPTDTRLGIRAVYLTNEIRLGAFCKADFNSDGLLNFFDISQFITEYNAGNPEADIAAPFGILNFFDIAEFITRYNTGCP
jgi:uncharacterized damage-inducible protein DinB